MRIIVYEDASVVIDELQANLSPGENTISFQAPGYVPGTLYVISEHRYHVSESTNVTVRSSDVVIRGELVQMDDSRVSIRDTGLGGDWNTLSQDIDGIVHLDDYISVSRDSTEITLTIFVDREDEEDLQYLIPVVYTTDMISGDIRYLYDVATDDFHAELLVKSEMTESITANIGIGATPLYSDLNTGDDILEYSLLGDQTLISNGQTSIPLDTDRFNGRDGDGVYVIHQYLIDLEDEEVFSMLSLERESAGEIRPPYPGTLVVLNNNIPIAEREVRRDLSTFDIGTTTGIRVETALDENGNTFVQIINNQEADLSLVLVYDDESNDLPNVQVLSPDDNIIPSTVERLNEEVQISFSTEGLGAYTVSIQ